MHSLRACHGDRLTVATPVSVWVCGGFVLIDNAVQRLWSRRARHRVVCLCERRCSAVSVCVCGASGTPLLGTHSQQRHTHTLLSSLLSLFTRCCCVTVRRQWPGARRSRVLCRRADVWPWRRRGWRERRKRWSTPAPPQRHEGPLAAPTAASALRHRHRLGARAAVSTLGSQRPAPAQQEACAAAAAVRRRPCCRRGAAGRRVCRPCARV